MRDDLEVRGRGVPPRCHHRQMAPVPEVMMYDSITLSNIPPGAAAVAGYVDGRWTTWHDVLRRWPRSRHVSITTTGASEADVCDCESGDLTPQGAVRWVAAMHARGHSAPGVYASLDTWVTSLQSLMLREYRRTEFRVWTAHYTHVPHRCSAVCDKRLVLPVDATQWTDRALGRDLDASLAQTTFFVHHP